MPESSSKSSTSSSSQQQYLIIYNLFLQINLKTVVLLFRLVWWSCMSFLGLLLSVCECLCAYVCLMLLLLSLHSISTQFESQLSQSFTIPNIHRFVAQGYKHTLTHTHTVISHSTFSRFVRCSLIQNCHTYKPNIHHRSLQLAVSL